MSKETYGNLLDDFSVYNYCDIVTWDKAKGQQWKIGNPKICGWKTENLNSYLPKIILNQDIYGNIILIFQFQLLQYSNQIRAKISRPPQVSVKLIYLQGYHCLTEIDDI